MVHCGKGTHFFNLDNFHLVFQCFWQNPSQKKRRTMVSKSPQQTGSPSKWPYKWLITGFTTGGDPNPLSSSSKKKDPKTPRSCGVRFRSLATELGSQQFPSCCSSEAQSGDGDGLDVPGSAGVKGEDQW